MTVSAANALAKLQGQLRENTKRLSRDLDGRHDRWNAGTCQLQRSLARRRNDRRYNGSIFFHKTRKAVEPDQMVAHRNSRARGAHHECMIPRQILTDRPICKRDRLARSIRRHPGNAKRIDLNSELIVRYHRV